ncbi:protein YnaN [Escherichia coli]|nr:protein YnaN [Escherichia coli]
MLRNRARRLDYKIMP